MTVALATIPEVSTPAIDTALHARFQKGIAAIFGAVVASPSFVRDWSVCMLFEAPVVEVGPPGVAKTLLARATGRALFGAEAAVVTCFEDARPEDLIYDVGISQLHGEGRSDYAFDVKARDVLTAPFVLVNEWNRLTPRTQNPFLGIFAEGAITVRGTTLRKARGKVVLDMNPYYGPMGDLAARDRFVACLTVERLSIADQFTMLGRKYGGGHVEDLAAGLEPVLGAADMLAIWEDVRRVAVPAQEQGRILLTTSVFSSCVHKLESVSEAFRDRLKCEECAYRRACVTRHLRQPVSVRMADAVVLLTKAHAWYEGRAVVDTRRDLLPALRLAIGHKVDLREEAAAEHPSVLSWFDRTVRPLLETRKAEWAQARVTYEQIDRSLKKGDVAGAGRILKTYRKSVRDITARQLVTSFAEPQIEAHAESAYQEARTKVDLMLSSKASYTRKDLADVEKDAAWLPERFLQEITDGLAALFYRMNGTFVVDADVYPEVVQAIAQLDAGALAGLGSPRAKVVYTVREDGTKLAEITVTPQGGRFEIDYRADSSEVADALGPFGAG
ncbi:MAG: MoxR family ATPase [Acidobacteriota bacterium]